MEIRQLHRAAMMPINVLPRRMGISKNTVKQALAADEPPKYWQGGRVRGATVDVVEPRIRELLRELPNVPATALAERVGWERSVTVLKNGFVSCGLAIGPLIRTRGPRISQVSWRNVICPAGEGGAGWHRIGRTTAGAVGAGSGQSIMCLPGGKPSGVKTTLSRDRQSRSR